MSSRLEEILAALQERVLALYPGVTFCQGQRFIASTVEAPPRIVWVRAIDQYAPAERTSPTTQAVLTRSTAVVAHCWAAAGGWYETDDEAVERLVDALAFALRAVLGAGALPDGAEWVDTPSVNAAGLACLVSFIVKLPVLAPDVPVARATTTAFDTTGASPGALDAGE